MNTKNIFNWGLIIGMLILANIAYSQQFDGLDLGEETVSGKKDQPEAMTFVSRGALDLRGQIVIVTTAETRIRKDMRLSGKF